MSTNGWIDEQLESAIEFRNGKSSPERTEKGENPVYGGNGIIGYTSEFNCDSETIIVGRVGAYCGSLYFNKGKCWVTDNAIIGKVKNHCDGKFLFYLLKKLDLNNYRSGSSQPLINQSTLNSIEVKLPSDKKVQTRIAAILSTLDDKIDLNRQINTTLEAIAQGLFKEWFVEFRFPAATGEMVVSEIGPIPKGWRVGSIGELSYVQNGFAFKSNDFIDTGEIGVIKIKTLMEILSIS